MAETIPQRWVDALRKSVADLGGDKSDIQSQLNKVKQELDTPYMVGARFKPLSISNPDRFEALTKKKKDLERKSGMTKPEFYENTKAEASRLLRMPADRHKKYVEDALKSGKSVPSKVLKDYPDLKKKYK